MKIVDGVRRGSVFGPTDGTPLSPVEVSPDITPGTSDAKQIKTDYIQQLEKDIVQSLNDLEASNALDRATDQKSPNNSDHESDCDVTDERRTSIDPDGEWKKRVMTQPKCLQTRRSDASEELAVRGSTANLEGARQSRPSDLLLFDEYGRPIAPPRLKSNEARNQRLLSVPNIKYNRTGDNVRSKVKKDAPTSSFAGNLMRRFSKYLHIETIEFKKKKKLKV